MVVLDLAVLVVGQVWIEKALAVEVISETER